MFSRITAVSKGSLVDDAGEDISKVESTLKRIGINLRDGMHSFRDAQDVIAEIGDKWNILSETDKTLVSQAVSGLHQREKFIVLMENQEKMEKALQVQRQEANLLTERYGIYLESVEAKANKAQAALEGVWQKTITSESIGQVYDMATAVLGLVDSVGGFIPIAIALGVAIVGVKIAMMGLNNQLIINNTLLAIGSGLQSLTTFFGLLASGSSVATAALTAFNITLGVTEILTGAVVIALAGLVLGMAYAGQESERAKAHFDELSKAVQDSGKALRDTEKNAKTVSDLGKAFDELKDKSIKTTKEQEKFVDIQNQLKDLMPEISGYYDDQGNFVIDLANNQEKLNAVQKEAIDIKKQKLAMDAEAFMNQADTTFGGMLTDLEGKKATAAAVKQDVSLSPDSWKITEADKAVKQQDIAIKEFVNNVRMNYSNLSKDQQEFWINYLKTQGEAGQKLAEQLKPVEDIWVTAFSKIDKDGGSAADSLKVFTDEVAKAKEKISSLKNGDIGIDVGVQTGENIKVLTHGLAEVQERLAQTSTSYTEYKELATEAFEAVGYKIDESGRVYTELTTTIDGVDKTTRTYLEGLEVLDEAEQKNIQTIYQSTDAYKAHAQTLKDVADGEFQIATQLKSLQDTAKLTGEMMAKVAGGENFNFADVQKLTEANKDYLQFISVVDGQVQINTEGLRQYDIQKAEDAYTTMYQEMAINGLTEAEQKQLDLMKAYIYSLADGSAYAEQLAAAQKKLADEQKKAAEEALKAQQDSIKIQIDLLKEQKAAADDLLKMTIAMIRQQKQEEKDHLNEQLDNYSRLIDARIEALDALKAEEDYKKGLQKDEKKISDIKSQIAILSLDSSPEAKAKILKLQEELAKLQEDMDEKIADHRLELQKQALEAEKKAFEESIKDKIAVIEDYLKQTGTITRDALDLIKNHGDELYQTLIEWNRVYGTGINEDVIKAWEKGREAVLNYQSIVIEISSQEQLLENLENIKNNVEQPWDDATVAVKDYSAAVDEALAKATALKGTLTGGVGGGVSSGAGSGTAGGQTTETPTGSAGGSTSTSTGNWWEDFINSIPLFPVMHSGLDAGPVGDLKTTTNERLIKALNGEIVLNQPQQESLLNRLTPNIPQTTSNISNMGGNMLNFDSLITVNGNVDKDMMPDLEKFAKKAADLVLDKINQGNFNRGMKRPSTVTSI